MKKLLCVLLIVSMLFAISPAANAATFVKSRSIVVSGSSQYGRTATMALWTADTVYRNFSSSNRTYHTKGTKTEYVCQKSETVTCTSNTTLFSGEYSDAFERLSNSLKVADSASLSMKLTGVYTIKSDMPTGYYQFRGEFTCYRVVEEVVLSKSTGDTVESSHIIATAPSTDSNAIVAYLT